VSGCSLGHRGRHSGRMACRAPGQVRETASAAFRPITAGTAGPALPVDASRHTLNHHAGSTDYRNADPDPDHQDKASRCRGLSGGRPIPHGGCHFRRPQEIPASHEQLSEDGPFCDTRRVIVSAAGGQPPGRRMHRRVRALADLWSVPPAAANQERLPSMLSDTAARWVQVEGSSVRPMSMTVSLPLTISKTWLRAIELNSSAKAGTTSESVASTPTFGVLRSEG
jgi:hypothetical protein